MEIAPTVSHGCHNALSAVIQSVRAVYLCARGSLDGLVAGANIRDDSTVERRAVVACAVVLRQSAGVIRGLSRFELHREIGRLLDRRESPEAAIARVDDVHLGSRRCGANTAPAATHRPAAPHHRLPDCRPDLVRYTGRRTRRHQLPAPAAESACVQNWGILEA